MNKKKQTIKKRVFNHHTVGVSEVIGVVLILAIVIGAMTGVYLMVFNPLNSGSTRAPAVELIASINEEGTQIFFEHRGGPPLSKNLEITVSLADTSYYLEPGSEQLHLDTDYWSFGQRMVYNVSEDTILAGIWIHVFIFDPDTNSILLDSVIQDGEKILNPIATIVEITPYYHHAFLSLHAYTRDYDGDAEFYFQYREKKTDPIPEWIDIPQADWKILTGANNDSEFTFRIDGLIAVTEYQCRAVAKFQLGGNDEIRVTHIKDFKTNSYVLGEWVFKQLPSLFYSDSSGYNNNIDSINMNSEYSMKAGVPDPPGNEDEKAAMVYGIDDYMQVDCSHEYNSLRLPEENITIEAWVEKKIDENYTSFEEPNVMDSADYPSLSPYTFNEQFDYVNVTDTIYALVSQHNSKGRIWTIEIDDNGIIEYIDFFEFTSSSTVRTNPRMIHVYDNQDDEYQLMAIVHTTHSNSKGGYITTVQINNTGEINKNADNIKTLQIEPSSNFFKDPDILKIKYSTDFSHFVIAYGTYQHQSAKNYYRIGIQTVNISHNTGVITKPANNNKLASVLNDGADDEYKEILGSGLHIFLVKNNYFAVIYSNAKTENAPNGEITVFSIEDSGELTLKKTEEIATSSCFNPKVIHLKEEGNNQFFVHIFQLATDDKMSLYYQFFNISNTGNEITHTNELAIGYSISVSTVAQKSFRFFHKLFVLNESADLKTVGIVFSDLNDKGCLLTVTIEKDDGTTTLLNDDDDHPRLFARECVTPNIVSIKKDNDATLLSIAYRLETDGTPMVKTFSLSNQGTLSPTYGGYKILQDVDELGIGYPVWYYPDMIHIYDDMYAVVSFNSDRKGNMTILQINDSGIITNKKLNSFIFDFYCVRPRVVPLSIDSSNSYLAVFYEGNQSNLHVTTLKIDTDGNIEKINTFWNNALSLTASLNGGFDVVEYNEIGEYKRYVMVYSEKNQERGFVTSIDIKSDGSDVDWVDDEAFAPNTHKPHIFPAITYVRDNCFAIVYSTYRSFHQYDGYVVLFEINDDGTIEINVDSRRQIINANSNYMGMYLPDITSIKGNFIAIAATYNKRISTNPNTYNLFSTISTWKIDEDNTISESQNDMLNIVPEYVSDDSNYQIRDHPNDRVRAPQFLHLKNDAYLITYRGPNTNSFDNKGRMGIVRINDTTGRISNEKITDKQFEDINIDYPYSKPFKILQDGDATILALAYGGRDDGRSRAQVKTIQINHADLPQQQLVAKGSFNDDTGYGLFINATNVSGKINDETLTAELQDGWNYVVLTKTPTTINLYLNANLIQTKSYDQEIQSNNDNLIFGRFIPVLLDEIKIRVDAMTQEQIGDIWDEYHTP